MNRFIIPCQLFDLNTYIDIERTNRFSAAKSKRKQTQLISLFCKKLDLPKDTQFDVECIWTTKDKRKDSDNVFFAVKFILDGVVTSGQLQGDGYRYIRNISHKRLIGKDEQVEVIFNLAK